MYLNFGDILGIAQLIVAVLSLAIAIKQNNHLK